MTVGFRDCIRTMLESLSEETIILNYNAYFENEENADLFEGFLRLLLTAEQLNKTINNNNKIFSYTKIFDTFYKRVFNLPKDEKDLILNSLPADSKILVSYL